MAIFTLLFISGTAAYAYAPNERHFSGLELVGALDAYPDPIPEALAQAHHDAIQHAKKYPDVMGYPWVDRANSRLVVSGITGAGVQAARQFRPSAKAGRVAIHVRDVALTWSRLEAIKDDATRLVEAGIPDADLIWATAPDEEYNRIVISVSKLSDRLLVALAARYGTSAVAVRVDSTFSGAGTSGRDNDYSPFWGGAALYVPTGTCTSGFPWISGSTEMMLTAAHCAPSGGSISTPTESMGTVTSGSRENWDNSTGTTYYSGQSTYRGDVALVQMSSGKSAGTAIYRGGPGSSSFAVVKEMWSRSPSIGDQYCTGGFVAGELCGWVVQQVRYNHKYDRDVPNVWARNITRGSKQGWCARQGDSGGPVYTVRSDGGIAAKGIHSGDGGGGGDHYGGSWDPCLQYFTDIWDPYTALPGVLKTG